MNIYIKAYVLLFDDDKMQFKIYLDDSGDIPRIKLCEEMSIEEHLLIQFRDYFYNVDDGILHSAKIAKVSKDESGVDIFYNFYCYTNLACKVGKFVQFDKKSMDLYRLSKNKGVQNE